MERKEKFCCRAEKPNSAKGIWPGILYGLIPHAFCIAFILFSIIGAVFATAFLKKFLLIPYFFYFLATISLLLATISAATYLKKTDCLCIAGIKNKWKYVATLYSLTILINLLMFFVINPVLANISSRNITNQEKYLSDLSLNVQIPCSGHAPLIIDEIKKNFPVQSVKFKMPNTFEITYDPEKTTPEKIASLEIFKTYEATIN
jgi:hypothetical protein